MELRSVELQGGYEAGGAPIGRGHVPTLVDRVWAPWCSTDLNSNSIYSCSGRKNQREGFITFYDMEPPPSPNLS